MRLGMAVYSPFPRKEQQPTRSAPAGCLWGTPVCDRPSDRLGEAEGRRGVRRIWRVCFGDSLDDRVGRGGRPWPAKGVLRKSARRKRAQGSALDDDRSRFGSGNRMGSGDSTGCGGLGAPAVVVASAAVAGSMATLSPGTCFASTSPGLLGALKLTHAEVRVPLRAFGVRFHPHVSSSFCMGCACGSLPQAAQGLCCGASSLTPRRSAQGTGGRISLHCAAGALPRSLP